MKILVVGGGGREHALVWKLAQSSLVGKIYCAPGNAGIGEQAECVPIAATEIERLTDFAAEKQIDLTVVGPEAPLCAGLVDALEARGLKAFGPNRRAAQLEGSKVFAKKLLVQAGVPTAAAATFYDAELARAHVRKQGAPIVVKADGLAAGKGVIVAQTVAAAEQAIEEIMVRRAFGGAGDRVVVEECLQGEEASVMALVDGGIVQVLAAAQDHKRVNDNDEGPNTGGMGAYSPTPVLPAALRAQVDGIFERTLTALRAQGIEYRGVLYAGLMLTAAGPKVLEFNCRFGDPETQAVVPRMDFDLAAAALATAEGRLHEMELPWTTDSAVCVVMASGGYPGHYERGRPIEGLQAAARLAKVCVFHAGTKQGEDGQVLTDGGRVLGVTALGADLPEAVRRVYQAVDCIHFPEAHYRRDIAARALRRMDGDGERSRLRR